MEGQVSLFGPDLECGKMCPDASPRGGTPKPEKRNQGRTSSRSSKRSSKLKNHTFMLLNLQPGAGNMLGPYWEYDPPWLGSLGIVNTSECPKDVVESSLSQILLDTVPYKYYLSNKACLGMLNRSQKRGKPLPAELEMAAMIQAGLFPHSSFYDETGRFAISRFTAGFSSGAGSSAGSIGYQAETTPTLKGSASGSMMPSVLCLNDQGGSIMEWSENVTGTLRAQEHGHQPMVLSLQPECETLLFDNHAIDARYTGPHPVSPTLSNRNGTGGNNLPIMLEKGRFYSRQRTDKFKEDTVAAAESARQYKDAVDLVCWPSGSLLFLRRLTPTECERLQGYPDGWTDLPKASDSARYRALGNSVAIPCVEHLMHKIAQALRFNVDSASSRSRGR